MAKNWIVGHTDGYTDSSSDNGGGYDVDTFMTSSTQAQKFAALHDGDGGPVSASGTWGGLGAACTMEGNNLGDETAYVQINYANGFEDVEVGMIANCEFNGTTYTDDRYEVLASASGYVVINLPYTSAVTCDCNVGGFFAAFSAPFSLDAVGAGDEVHVAGGYTYTQSAGVSIPTGSDTARVAIRGVDTSGDFVPIVQSDSDKSLTTTNHAKIDMDEYSMIFLDYTDLESLDITGSSSQYVVDSGSADYCSLSNCKITSTGTGTFSRCVELRTYAKINSCEIINESTGLASTAFQLVASSNSMMVNSRVLSNSGGCVSMSGFIANSLFIGDSESTSGIYGSLLVIINSTFIDLLNITTYATNSGLMNIMLFGNVSQGVETGIANLATSAIIVLSNSNVFNGMQYFVSESITGVVDGFIEDDTIWPQGTTIFEDVSGGDYRLDVGFTGNPAIGGGIGGNDAGAIQSESTGGGGDTVVISKGMLGVLG